MIFDRLKRMHTPIKFIGRTASMTLITKFAHHCSRALFRGMPGRSAVLLMVGSMLALAGTPSWSATYYVSAAARDAGDSCSADNGDGSLNNPWASLYFATRKLKPGDTLYIRGGVYREEFTPFSTQCQGQANNATIGMLSGIAGTAAAPVLIRPYKNENVVVYGTPISFDDTKTEWKQCESTSLCGQCSGLNIPNYSKMYYRSINLGSAPRSQFYVDPGLLTEGPARPGQRLGFNGQTAPVQNGDAGLACSDINKLVPGTFANASNGQITLFLSDGSDPDNHRIICSSEIGGCAPQVFYITNSSYIRLSGMGDDGQKHMQILGGYYTIYIDRSSNITIDHIYLHNIGTNEYGDSIRTNTYVTDLMIDSVEIDETNAHGLGIYSGGVNSCAAGSGADRVTVQNSIIRHTGRDIYGMKGISQTLGDGILVKGGNNVRILNNYIEDTQRDGITVYPHDACDANNAIIRGNEVVNACNNPRDAECAGIALKQHAVVGPSTSKNALIENNLVRDISGRPGFEAVRGIRQTGWGSAFGNNTIRFNTVDIRQATGPGIHLDGDSNTAPSAVFGNLVLGNSSNPALHGYASNQVGSHGNNTFWMPSNSTAVKLGTSVYSRDGLTSWETSAVQAAPVFTTGYRLAGNAPQVDKGGSSCSGISIYGTSRPQGGACDIGADEFGSGSTALPPPTNFRVQSIN